MKEAGKWKPTVAQLKELIAKHRENKSDSRDEDSLELFVFCWALDNLHGSMLEKEMLRFYTDRLRVVTDYETGASKDEIDLLEFENEMLRHDKNRYRDENISLKPL